MIFLRFSYLLFVLLFFFGCASYKVPTDNFLTFNPTTQQTVKATANREKAIKHWAYKIIPKHRSQIHTYDLAHWLTWALLGNDDDGFFAEENTSKFLETKEIGLKRASLWALRNPFHNLTFYVIGTAYWDNSELAILQLAKEKNAFFDYRHKGGIDFAGKSTSLFLGLHGWKPFMSLRLNYGRLLEMYVGWRWRGNFGLKLKPFTKIPKTYEDDYK